MSVSNSPLQKNAAFLSATVSTPEFSEEQLKQAEEIAKKEGLSLITAKILVLRGFSSAEAVNAYLKPTLREHLPDPEQIKNLKETALYLLKCVKSKKLITVYSDFDVDGLTSGTQLYLYLKSLGARVNHFAPNRFSDGYGLVKNALEKLADNGTEILVTVDCGITSSREISIAKAKGMGTVIIDHHQFTELPPADYIVNPAQTDCNFEDNSLCAAGLVWMLLISLKKQAENDSYFSDNCLIPPSPKDFLDLAAFGTICDMVPLKGINRLIAQRGLEALRKSERIGIKALMEVSKAPQNERFSAGHVSFLLGPRVNAAGRLGDAKEVFELLTTDNPEKATNIAASLNKLNTKRRGIETKVVDYCLTIIDSNMRIKTNPAFAIFHEDFHAGVIGIAAQRLVEKFNKPSAVMAPGTVTINGELKPVIKGSVRSIRGFNVAEVLQKLSNADLLISGGGHAKAGGFSVLPEKLKEFSEAFIAEAKTLLNEELLQKTVHAELEIDVDDLNFEVVNELACLAPHGIGNPAPVFVSSKLQIESVTSVSSDHLKLKVKNGGQAINAVAWKFRGHPLIKKGNKINLAYTTEINNYQGVSSVQLNVKEVW